MNNLKYFSFIIFFSFFILENAQSKIFTFAGNEPLWNFYGEGLGAYVSDMGRGKDQSSLWMSADYGETETVFFTWKDLTPGNYRIKSYIRAQDLQKGDNDYSFWNFYDSGFGTQSPFTDLYGNFEWRKIEYNIKVKGSDLTVWFRLKTPGQVWIDDFSIEKIGTTDEKISIENAVPLDEKAYKKKSENVFKSLLYKKLYSFDTNEEGHPFAINNKAGEFDVHQFYNFNINKMPVRDWSNYDRLEMDIYNPNENFCEFFVNLADDLTTNYWSQANYKQTLAPGWNRLSFSLKQFVGERGSNRFFRSINLAKLRKFFIVIDPDSNKVFPKKKFLIDNIGLSFNPMPVVPSGVLAFDFTSIKSSKDSNLTKVTSQTLFNNERGYGFIGPKFDKIDDSQFASESLRYSIGLFDGHFKIKLPNGKYQISLIIDKLGYWDVPFWSDRMIFANGNPIYKDVRSSGKDFLSDLLQFEHLEPKPEDHPYDLYLSKIFRSIDKIVDVNNGVLDLAFHGDTSGINLNSLIIWNKKNDSVGVLYKKLFENRNKIEFDWMSRSIQKKSIDAHLTKLSISIVEPDLNLNYTSLKKASSNSLNFFGGGSDSPNQMIQLNSANKDEKISWSLGDLTNASGEVISSKNIKLSELIYQYTSPDNNHETYLIAGKFLRPLQDSSLLLKKNQSKYLWMQISINDKMPKGVFKGEFLFHRGGEIIKFPIEMTILSYSLPKVDFPVGFFGIDPLPFSYFSGMGYDHYRKKYRYMALNALGEAGFTTYTGLPSSVSDLDELFKESSKWGIQTVFSYGGQFPQLMLDLKNKPNDMSETEFYEKNSKALKLIISNRKWPKIVHTFSDEASGYSDKLASDIDLAKKLKKYFPFLSLGGFGSFNGGDSNKLNSYFDYGFYSSLSKSDIRKLKESGQLWGFYNASSGNLDDPRFSFGLGLYIARLNGLSNYLEWHSSAFSNYPYYDFDGREADNVMFYPTLDGKLLPSLRFELAVEGLHAYKKLKLLENYLSSFSGTSNEVSSSRFWLEKLRKDNYFYSSKQFLNQKDINFREFEIQLNQQLKNIFMKK